MKIKTDLNSRPLRRSARNQKANQSRRGRRISRNSKNGIDNSSAVCDISSECKVNDITEIHKLNDDCLMRIFSYVPRGNRFVLEKVCRRWEIVSRRTWHTFRKFNLKEKTWGDNSICENLKNLKVITLQKVLYRCGSILTHVNFSGRSRYLGELDEKVVSVFAKYCENLKHIDIVNSNLRTIAHNPMYEKELSKLFLNNKKLRFVRLVDTAITGECLLNLCADSLEVLAIKISHNISACHFENALKKFHKLNTLLLTHCKSLTYKTFNTICFSAKSSNLKVLKFHELLRLTRLKRSELLCIKDFSNLEILDVRTISIDDQALKEIAEKCKKLRTVNLSDNSEISNDGLIHIVSLPKLELLGIGGLPKITDEVLIDMPNLRFLKCSSCERMKNRGLCQLIEKSHNLATLDVSGCSKVNNELVEVAIKATKNRTNNVILKIYVQRTGINLNHFTPTASPFLRLIGIK